MTTNANQSESLRRITPEALALLGAPNLAYIRPVEVDGGPGWGIFAANGQAMGVVDDREVAFAAARVSG
jgi:hypothetical protein